MTRARRRRTDRSAKQNRVRPSTAAASGEEIGATGTLEVLPDGYGFLRHWEESFASSVDDAYVPRSLIDRFGLATSCEIQGISQAVHDGQHGARLKQVTTVNGLSPEEFRKRPSFEKLTPLQPRQRLHLESCDDLSLRVIDLVDTGTRMDGFIFEEFKGTGNMEVHLSRQLAERQVWPAVDISASGTRREELLLDADEMQRVRLLRKALSQTEPADAMELLIDRLGRTRSNAEFLLSFSLDS